MDKLLKFNDFYINYSDSEKGDISLIFIHGFPFDKSSWEPQIEFFEKKYRVVCLDLRGFGKSSLSKSDVSIDVYADDIIHLMNKLKIESAVICGLSMGGYIALNLIERYRNRISALVLCDTQCIADSAEVKEKRYTTIKELQNGNKEKFAEGFVKNVFSNTYFLEKENNVKLIKELIISNLTDSIISALKALASRRETCFFLNKIDVPVLIICGSEDKLTPLDRSLYFYENIPESKFVIIDGAGHLSNLENPFHFNKALQEFLVEKFY